MKLNILVKTFTSIAIALMLVSCATSGKKPVAERRQAVLDMKNEVLKELYALRPETRAEINNAPGYGVFSNASIQILLVGGGGGNGVVKNNKTGKHTYMKVGELGLGPGIGISDFRVIFVFHTEDSLKRFVEKGWSFGAQASASAKASDKGGSAEREGVLSDISIYQVTASGLALHATLKGRKFWRDKKLND